MVLIRWKCLLEGGAYFDLILKQYNALFIERRVFETWNLVEEIRYIVQRLNNKHAKQQAVLKANIFSNTHTTIFIEYQL